MKNIFNSSEEEEALDEQKEAKVIKAFGLNTADLLIENGFGSLDAVYDASDEELLAVSGIGEGTLQTMREFLAKREKEGVSEETATTPSEVKPVSKKAKAAEEESAESSSAGKVSKADVPPGGGTAVRSLFPSALSFGETPSGKTYVWEGPGSQVNVAAEDLESVMERNGNAGRACCGGTHGHTYFELA